MLKNFILCSVCFVGALFAEVKYTICVDGGGSKTALSVLDQEGNYCSLYLRTSAFKESEQQNNRLVSTEVVSSSSNINTLGKEKVYNLFKEMFDNVQIDSIKLKDLLGECRFVGGFAGLGREENKQEMTELLVELGLKEENLELMTDVGLSMNLIKEEGIVLIAGTGSICFGKKDGQIFRVGGLGPVLGDEGSGYRIGIEAIKAALADEYGWGEQTLLTQEIRKYFGVELVRHLIPGVTRFEISTGEVASLTSMVSELAKNGDCQAQRILEESSQQLADLVKAQLEISGLNGGVILLHGGVFAMDYYPKPKNPPNMEGFRFINLSTSNPAVMYVKDSI